MGKVFNAIPPPIYFNATRDLFQELHAVGVRGGDTPDKNHVVLLGLLDVHHHGGFVLPGPVGTASQCSCLVDDGVAGLGARVGAIPDPDGDLVQETGALAGTKKRNGMSE